LLRRLLRQWQQQMRVLKKRQRQRQLQQPDQGLLRKTEACAIQWRGSKWLQVHWQWIEIELRTRVWPRQLRCRLQRVLSSWLLMRRRRRLLAAGVVLVAVTSRVTERHLSTR
jgi:hypothetical protein